MRPELNPFCAAAIATFEIIVAEAFVEAAHVNPSTAQELASFIAHELKRKQQDSFESIRAKLKETGISSRWNRTFAERRAKVLGGWIRPWVEGTCLDLLCGDGSVASCLSSAGIGITLAERRIPTFRPGAFYFYEELRLNRPLNKWDTVVLSTVLHHETNPDELLSVAKTHAEKHLIIIENTVTTSVDIHTNVLIDLFFNCGLNESSLPSPGTHHTKDEWWAILSKIGEIVAFERRQSVPGVPLPHDLFVVDIES